MRKTILTPVFALMFVLAAGMASAAISSDLSHLKIKPETNFSVNDTAYLDLHVVSLGPSQTPFTVNITLTGGSTNLTSVYVSEQTGNCDAFRCVYDETFGFRITGAGDFSYEANITDNSTNESDIIDDNSTTYTDEDGDGYFLEIDDCNDNDASIHPGAPDNTNDGIDNDCDGEIDEDYTPPSDDDGGGSSGGGGGAGGPVTAMDYNCLDENVTVGKNDRIKFEYGGDNYTFFINDVLAGSIQVKLYPIPSRDYSINEDSDKYLDLDRNNRNDFVLEVGDIERRKAEVACRLTEEIGGTSDGEEEETESEEDTTPVMQNVKEGVVKIASKVVPKDKASPIAGSLIALAVVVAGLLIYYITRRGDDEEEF
ncbi:MAG: putative metal-binding motif-containing protein [Candidatus Woesearchaeota archaeon]